MRCDVFAVASQSDGWKEILLPLLAARKSQSTGLVLIPGGFCGKLGKFALGNLCRVFFIAGIPFRRFIETQKGNQVLL